jgi:RND family efflux transporter MFP subunit
VVGDVPVRTGDRVTRSTVLTTINDNARLEAHIGVPVQQATQLRIGQPLRLVDDGGAALLSTHVTFVAASVDDGTQTVLVKAPVEARAGQFRAEQFVRAQIVWSSQPGLTVPVLATQRINSQYFVFVAAPAGDGFVARQRPVTLGPLIGSAYVVLGGLSPGDRLIMSGTQKIGDGAPVQALPPSGGGQPWQSPPTGAR